MKQRKFGQIACALLCTLLGAGAAHAIDDRFDPARYEKGGFAPVDDALYAKECGSCHFTYLPGMLPARSWHALIGRSGNHFGEALSLAPETARHIEQYLVSNAADASSFRGSEVILYRLEEKDVPTRITALPVIRQRHQVVRKLLAPPNTSIKSLTNCDSCHEKAAAGSFAYGEIVVPGVTKVIKPGGLF